MAIDPSIRKQAYHLTSDDLDACPVWEWALDEEGIEGQDEATVRPADPNELPNLLGGQCVARASFLLADGTQFSGLLTPPFPDDASDLGLVQPIILTAEGQVGFWRGMLAPSPEEVAEAYRLLGKSGPASVFPLRYRLDLSGVSADGVIPGFMVLKDFATQEIEVVV